jgi:hypothetical protein
MSDPACRRGQRYGTYLGYADESAAIIAWELEWTRPSVCAALRIGADPDPNQNLFLFLSCHHADYLSDIGVEPDPRNLRLWSASNRERLMRAARHPDLIVEARGSEAGLVKVLTADGKKHRVTEVSFDAHPMIGVYLLRKCVEV